MGIETEGCDELGVVFDRSDRQPLKNNTRPNRTKGLSAVHDEVSEYHTF